MKITRLYNGDDNLSHFEDIELDIETERELGAYSKKLSVEGMLFRRFPAGLIFDWHNAPTKQYIIYQQGQVEVQASDGEIRIFNPGDVLLAVDLDGTGHITKTLSAGRSIIVTLET